MRFRLRRTSARLRRRLHSFPKLPGIIFPVVLALIFFSLVFSGYHLLFDDSNLDHSLARTLLRRGLPIAWEEEPNGGLLDVRSLIYLLTDYDLKDPLTILEETLPFFARSLPGFRIWEERPFVFVQELSFAPDPIRPAPADSVFEQKTAARALIYHTHTSEMYLGRTVSASQSNQAHYQFRNLADPAITGVMAVGRHLTNALNQLGIKTLHETRIHTLPNINHSYSNSEKTVREILAKQRELEMVIDLHRDAGVPNPSTVINGRSVARLALVIGTAERIPLVHANYQANLDFAQRIKDVCDEMYPSLMRPIQVRQDARYNQHLHPKSIIIELGVTS